MAGYRLDICAYLRESLFTTPPTETLRRLLLDLAPNWSQRVELYRARNDQRPIDLTESGNLAEAIWDAAEARGSLYKTLIAQHEPRYVRKTGSIEFRGATRALIVVAILDEWEFCRIGDGIHIANSVAFQVCRKRIEGQDARLWAAQLFYTLAERFRPFYANAYLSAEHEAKNMELSHGVRAIGKDISSYLPGLYWLNFFGSEFVSTIGKGALMSAPAADLRETADGVVLKQWDNPDDWNTDFGRDIEAQTFRHLGGRHFFSRSSPKADTVSPFASVSASIPRPY